MEPASQPHDVSPAQKATGTLIRCDTAEALPGFPRSAKAIVDAGSPFAWWVDNDADPILGFIIDKLGAAYRIRLPEERVIGLFADFDDAIRHGVALSDEAVTQQAVELRETATASIASGSAQ